MGWFIVELVRFLPRKHVQNARVVVVVYRFVFSLGWIVISSCHFEYSGFTEKRFMSSAGKGHGQRRSI